MIEIEVLAEGLFGPARGEDRSHILLLEVVGRPRELDRVPQQHAKALVHGQRIDGSVEGFNDAAFRAQCFERCLVRPDTEPTPVDRGYDAGQDLALDLRELGLPNHHLLQELEDRGVPLRVAQEDLRNPLEVFRVAEE